MGMADSYLEAPAHDRLERTRDMIQHMGLAVMNGATTTIGAAAFMCATYIIFFKKFGIVILVTVFQSLITSLIFFSAMMALMGPQGTFGTISCCCLRSCCVVGKAPITTTSVQPSVEADEADDTAGQKDVQSAAKAAAPVLLQSGAISFA